MTVDTTTRNIMEWFKSKRIYVSVWHSQSPDIHPVENLWQNLKIPGHRLVPTYLTKEDGVEKNGVIKIHLQI